MNGLNSNNFSWRSNPLMKGVKKFVETEGKRYVCEGDLSTIKKRTIQAIQMMPDEVVDKLLKLSPICSPGRSMRSMFGGKKQKTRKQKRKQKQRKTRKH